MDKAIALAEQFGIGAVGVRNSNHFGAAGAYVLQAAERGMIGIASTNAPACMAPWGGITQMLGNNPIAFAAPRANGDPFVVDFALSQVAKGWVRLAYAAKRAIPSGWAMDAQGRPTTDSAEAMRGLLVPIGMYKGTGLSIAMDFLAGLLVGSTPSADLAHQESTDAHGLVGHFFLALQIERFIALSDFQAKAGALLDRIESSARAIGVDRILIPGKIEANKERAAARDGDTHRNGNVERTSQRRATSWSYGAAGRNRTANLGLRSPSLYPIELRPPVVLWCELCKLAFTSRR